MVVSVVDVFAPKPMLLSLLRICLVCSELIISGPNSVVSQICKNIEISLCISHFESPCDRDHLPDPLDQ